MSEAKAEFLRVQYLPDLFRDEPLNVGVVVRKEGELAAKFVGEMEPGELDGRKLRSFGNPSVYSQWVRYWRKVLATEGEDALQELVETSGAHFRVVPGGEVTDYSHGRMFHGLDNASRHGVAVLTHG